MLRPRLLGSLMDRPTGVAVYLRQLTLGAVFDSYSAFSPWLVGGRLAAPKTLQ